MDTHQLPRRIPEYGVANGAHRERHRAVALIGALCGLAFVYSEFPAVAGFLDTVSYIAVAALGTTLVIAGVVLTVRKRIRAAREFSRNTIWLLPRRTNSAFSATARAHTATRPSTD